MELFKQIFNHYRNTYLPIQNTISWLTFTVDKYTTYNELIRTYEPNLIPPLKNKGFFDQKIVVFLVKMDPIDKHWMIWKNFNQIAEFLDNLNQEIQKMKKIPEFQKDRFGKQVGLEISQQFMILNSEFQKGIANFNQKLVNRFNQFMNKLGDQLFLSKSVIFLTFIGHCISIDKWHVMIHHQIYIYKSPVCFTNKIVGLFTSVKPTKQIACFVTIIGDGILISDDHLMLSKVNQMIPFTNQMKIKCFLTGNQDFIYQITSGKSNVLTFNFYKDYIAGTNFGLGLGKALKYSGYRFLMGINPLQNQSEYPSLSLNTDSKLNRFQSYAQVRSNCNAKFYNDGCGYYEDLYNELMKAEKQVCITGWMITPYFLLKRPGNIQDVQYRLDDVLGRLAQRGVKVFVIVFMEPAMLVNNDSEFVQNTLQNRHKNIKVYRHPNVAIPQLWSHHQKLVVIDQKVGFMGGLDICYGRWDTPEHKLVQNTQDRSKRFWDGCDFNNYRLKDIYQPRNFQKSNLNKDFQPRMPWHDIAVQIRGDVVVDLLRHFVQYWYFVRSQLTADPRKLYVLLQKRYSQAISSNDQLQKKYLISQIKNDTQQTFQQKFNSFRDKLGVFAFGGEKRISELLIEQRTGLNQGNLNIQMLRSASEWSIGLDDKKHQCSIHNAYQKLIQQSQTHIYIENQFFMGLENKIVECIANRIIKARNNQQKFRVVIVMPLLPGFQGYIADPAASVLRIQMHWQYQAISRGGQSLFVRLTAMGFTREEIDNYIYFFGLRKGQILNNIPVTQIIYVHSKLMIVDDYRMIIGSANINDRSLLGNRDSQIAICVQTYQMERLNQFRRRIFEQHFGLKKNESIDVLDDTVWKGIIQQAKLNTNIFRQVFGCVPDDQIKKIDQIDSYQQKNCDISRWFNLNSQIKGHAVQFPIQFLSEEDLTFSYTQKQILAPVHTFT